MQHPVFISEVSSNHARQLERCYAFIDTSSRIGCDAVKFQLFKINELFAPEILEQSEIHRARKDWELPEGFIPDLARRCRQRGIGFACTPFYLDAVTVLEPYVDFFKIASYELLWRDLLHACGKTKKPVVLSTGMANMQEIEAAVRVLQDSGCADITLLHCVSGYPAPFAQANLAAMQTMRDRFQCKIGWSDHTVEEGVIQRAVHAFQADIIEFHLDLDGAGDEYTSGHCWLPQDAQRMIHNVRVGLTCDGDGSKTPVAVEEPDRLWRADPNDGLRPLQSIRSQWVLETQK